MNAVWPLTSMCLCVCGGVCAKRGSLCISFHAGVCVHVRVLASVQMLFRGFSALLFSARACLQHGGRGQGLQRNHYCLHPLVKCQPLDHPPQPRVSLQKPVLCVCLAFAFSPAFSHGQLTPLLWDIYIFYYWGFHLSVYVCLSGSCVARLPAASTRSHFNNEINEVEEQLSSAAFRMLHRKLERYLGYKYRRDKSWNFIKKADLFILWTPPPKKSKEIIFGQTWVYWWLQNHCL